MNGLIQDIRFAVRMLVKTPGFTSVALVTLALGIAATTAIFSVVNAVLLEPLPYRDPDRIARVWETSPRMHDRRAAGFSLDNFREWRENNTSFDYMAAYRDQSFVLGGRPEPIELFGLSVSPELFAVLGEQAAHGRTLLRNDENPGQERVIVLSHRTWTRYFGGDPSVVEQDITLDGRPFTLVGVMPPGFEFPDSEADFWIPLVLGPPPDPDSNVRRVIAVPVIARVKDGVSFEQAEAEGKAMVLNLRSRSPGAYAEEFEPEIHLESLQAQMVGPVRQAMLVLAVSVVVLLLIACTNVANLLLSRAAQRQREMALRSAIGASGSRLVRQALTESCILALLGGAFGFFLAWAGVRLFVGLASETLPRSDEIGMDPTVLVFSLLVSLATGIVFGLVPAYYGRVENLTDALNEASSQSAVPAVLPGQGKLRAVLASAEVALALILLVGAALLINSFLRLSRVEPGYNADNALVMTLKLPGYRYAGSASRITFHERVLEEVRAVPGVQAAGLTNLLPLTPAQMVVSFGIEGRPAPTRADQVPRANFRMVSPGFFRAMGMELRRGRVLTEQDRKGSPSVVVVNESLVRQYFPDDDPLGQRIQMGEIVGVVGDVLHEGLESESQPELYISYLQASGMMSGQLSRMSLVMRTSGEPLGLLTAVQERVRSIDPEMPRFEGSTLEQRVADSVARPRLHATLMGIFSVVAAFLAAVGIYGVISYAVAYRSHEIGIRVALGAQYRDILGMVLRQGAAFIVAGITFGLVLTLLLSRLLTSLLFGISPTDGATLTLVSVGLAAVALLACYFPARRAARSDPLVSIRHT
jgi:putative ABC transport system permease protein